MGMKIKTSGRFLRDSIKKRRIVQRKYVGTLNTHHCWSVDYNKYTAKAPLGAFTVKIWLGLQ